MKSGMFLAIGVLFTVALSLVFTGLYEHSEQPIPVNYSIDKPDELIFDDVCPYESGECPIRECINYGISKEL